MQPERAPVKILLVEDHADTRDSLARLLRLFGYDVSCAVDGASARVLAAAEPFDLMLCDLGLPDGDGCDLMRSLATTVRLKGIAISGYGMPDDVRAARLAGFCEHLTKPVSFEKLKAAIEAAVGTGGASQPAQGPMNDSGSD